MFPKFLSRNDIEYLINLAYRETEAFRCQILINFYKTKCQEFSKLTINQVKQQVSVKNTLEETDSVNGTTSNNDQMRNSAHINKFNYLNSVESKEDLEKNKYFDSSPIKLENTSSNLKAERKRVTFQNESNRSILRDEGLNGTLENNGAIKSITQPNFSSNILSKAKIEINKPHRENNLNVSERNLNNNKRRSYNLGNKYKKKYSKFNSKKNILFNEAISEEARINFTNIYNKEKKLNKLIQLQSQEEEETEKKIDELKVLLNKQHCFNSSTFYKNQNETIPGEDNFKYNAYNVKPILDKKSALINLKFSRRDNLINRKNKQNTTINNDSIVHKANNSQFDNSISVYFNLTTANGHNSNSNKSFQYVKNFREEFESIFKKELHIELLSENPKLKYYLEQIVIIRSHLNNINEEVEQLKEKKLVEFHKLYDFKKALNSYDARIQRDIVSSCLFGNSIAV